MFFPKCRFVSEGADLSEVRCRSVSVPICLRKGRNVLVQICPSANMSSILPTDDSVTISLRNFVGEGIKNMPK